MAKEECKPAELAETIRKNMEPKIVDIGRGNDQAASVALIPAEMKVVDLKPFLDSQRVVPERRKGVIKLDRLGSLAAITNRFKNGESALFASAAIDARDIAAKIETIFDYDPAGGDVTKAENKGHKAVYDFPISKDFAVWLQKNQCPMTQQDFALFLEERHIDMASPTDEDRALIDGLKPKFAEPLEMVELSRDLEIYSNESFKSKTRLSSGEVAVSFTAEHVDGNGKPVTIPDFFILNVPIFEGGEPTRVYVRLRYRVSGGKVVWFYDLYRIDVALNTAFEQACRYVEEETALPLYFGTST